MNHKLRVLVRVDVDPGLVTLEAAGCLTQANYPSLLHIMRRASRLAAGADVRVNLDGASHLDPEILLDLRQLAATPDPAAGPGDFQLFLQEPDDLPICLLHIGPGGEILAGLDGAEADSAETAAGTGDLIDGLELSGYFEGTLDPAATVQALSDAALGQLADALYRHLDTASPSFGAHTWYELAAEELQRRYGDTDGDGPERDGAAEDNLAAGPALP